MTTINTESQGVIEGGEHTETEVARSGPGTIATAIRAILNKTMHRFTTIKETIEASYLDEYTAALNSLSRCLSLFSNASPSSLNSYNPAIAQREFTRLRAFFSNLETEHVYEKLQHLRHLQGNNSIASILHPSKGSALFLRIFEELAARHPHQRTPIRIGSSRLGCQAVFHPDTLLKNLILDEDDGLAQLARLKKLLGLVPPVRDAQMAFLEGQANGSLTRVEEVINIIERYAPGAKVTRPGN